MRFIDNQNGTITDTTTNLMWQKYRSDGPMSWNDAREYATRLFKYTNWRLPTIEELITLIDFSRHHPATDPIFNCRSHGYWSSSTYAYNPDFAWVVYFGYGYVDAYAKSLHSYVRCVRGV